MSAASSEDGRGGAGSAAERGGAYQESGWAAALAASARARGARPRSHGGRRSTVSMPVDAPGRRARTLSRRYDPAPISRALRTMG
ncbi:Uncharacterised protein [Mycobacteroides abscessus subsp. abscessus]|nr:Uncharacterised protein [Mycobacteroides abscessus subsp. abscessus]